MATFSLPFADCHSSLWVAHRCSCRSGLDPCICTPSVKNDTKISRPSYPTFTLVGVQFDSGGLSFAVTSKDYFLFVLLLLLLFFPCFFKGCRGYLLACVYQRETHLKKAFFFNLPIFGFLIARRCANLTLVLLPCLLSAARGR